MADVIIAIGPVADGRGLDVHRIILSDDLDPGEGMLALAGRGEDRSGGGCGGTA
jgi:hypothetical protein